jgi:hypothetical protein
MTGTEKTLGWHRAKSRSDCKCDFGTARRGVALQAVRDKWHLSMKVFFGGHAVASKRD